MSNQQQRMRDQPDPTGSGMGPAGSLSTPGDASSLAEFNLLSSAAWSNQRHNHQCPNDSIFGGAGAVKREAREEQDDGFTSETDILLNDFMNYQEEELLR